MKNNILPAIRLTLVCLVFFCGIYTAIIWGVAQVSSGGGKGQTITQDGKTYYSNLGQNFTSDQYFWSRPSAASYNSAGSSGSNKGPTNPDYLAEVQARIDTFLVHNPEIDLAQIPSDLVTASGSGLDPHISVQAALVQVKRIAKKRNLSETDLTNLIQNHTESPLLGFAGTEKINVLQLNLALDQLQ
ncbi:K(+)-transporting ATPase subunit C [Algoriphagus sp. A40]|uniref:K(+)-transporting ATPase subunit C n=1 Tax=Algoriphagus sp. A40 TaxID=1945863 RepID=UPI000985F0C1|nr:K(+)-transporting ATPase subunit C [Algoriphagus sp. A40]OOG77633.1 potassium-transporting ATPase subunit C [Algoriphagus sp. A40]